MDASVFALDLPAWLSGIADVPYVASLCVALLALMIVSCIAGQAVNPEDDPVAGKNKTRLS